MQQVLLRWGNEFGEQLGGWPGEAGGLQNNSTDFARAVLVVAAAKPETFIQAIEDEAEEDEFVVEAADRLAAALVQRMDRENVYGAMASAASKWLGSFSQDVHADVLSMADSCTHAVSTVALEDLYDCAARFVARLDIRDWPRPLICWARRQNLLSHSSNKSRSMDMDLRWLGLSQHFDDRDSQAILAEVSADPSCGPGEQALIADLLNGVDFKERQRANQEARKRTDDRAKMQRHVDAYVSAEGNVDAWWNYRRLLQTSDRRVTLFTRAAVFTRHLDRSRRAYHELMSGEFEWFAHRNEGGLDHAFAGTRLPSANPFSIVDPQQPVFDR